jgi:hypothetical protein
MTAMAPTPPTHPQRLPTDNQSLWRPLHNWRFCMDNINEIETLMADIKSQTSASDNITDGKDEELLETGAGGSTTCEVELLKNNESITYFEIEPIDVRLLEPVIISFISLLCFGFTSSLYGNVDEDKEVRSASFRRSAL